MKKHHREALKRLRGYGVKGTIDNTRRHPRIVFEINGVQTRLIVGGTPSPTGINNMFKDIDRLVKQANNA